MNFFIYYVKPVSSVGFVRGLGRLTLPGDIADPKTIRNTQGSHHSFVNHADFLTSMYGIYSK